ncbi:MAG: hypothetical protein MI924_00155 [Chloroflexales bacterium]|nr:hypothetical protein [Chloroflexales bacterium]
MGRSRSHNSAILLPLAPHQQAPHVGDVVTVFHCQPHPHIPQLKDLSHEFDRQRPVNQQRQPGADRLDRLDLLVGHRVLSEWRGQVIALVLKILLGLRAIGDALTYVSSAQQPAACSGCSCISKTAARCSRLSAMPH